MSVDQEWVRENIDKMVAAFVSTHAKFRDKRHKSGLSQHKRRSKEISSKSPCRSQNSEN
jgi:hypothetical protein